MKDRFKKSKQILNELSEKIFPDEGNNFMEKLLQNAKENAELKAYKDVNEDFKTAWEELKAENDRLKEEIKEVKKYQYKQEYLEKEIETVKVNLDIGKEEARHYLHEAYKFQKCLQEIKAIAEKRSKEGLTHNYYKGLQQIIDLITKAEEE